MSGVFAFFMFIFLILSSVTSAKCLSVATPGDYRPFSAISKTGKYYGFDIELAKMFGKSLERKVCFKSTSWATLMQDYAAKKFDIAVGGISITKERKKSASFSHGYVSLGKLIVYRCDSSKISDKGEFDRASLRAVVNEGGTNEEYLRRCFKKVRILVHHDNNTIFNEILNNKADFMVTDSVEAEYQVANNKLLCSSKEYLPNSQVSIGALVRSKKLKLQFDLFLNKISENGQLKSLKQKYSL